MWKGAGCMHVKYFHILAFLQNILTQDILTQLNPPPIKGYLLLNQFEIIS